MIVKIAYHRSPAALAAVRELLAEATLNDLDFCGVEFEIERGDYTCVIFDESRAVPVACADRLIGEIFAVLDEATVPNDSSVEPFFLAPGNSQILAYRDFLRFCRAEVAMALSGQNQRTKGEPPP